MLEVRLKRLCVLSMWFWCLFGAWHCAPLNNVGHDKCRTDEDCLGLRKCSTGKYCVDPQDADTAGETDTDTATDTDTESGSDTEADADSDSDTATDTETSEDRDLFDSM